MLKALLFGAIGSLAETSEVQRRAFNKAFEEAGLAWTWDEALYRNLLEVSGGKNRIRHYAKVYDTTNETLSEEKIAALHSRKTAIYNETLAQGELSLRPGVARLIKDAKVQGVQLGLASATSVNNIEAIAAASGGALRLEDFDAVMNADKVKKGKPDPDVYETCLKELGVDARSAVAVEDTAISVQAAKNAGLVCVATPGKYTSAQDFSNADAVVGSLGEPDQVVEVSGSPHALAEGFITLDWLGELLEKNVSRG